FVANCSYWQRMLLGLTPQTCDKWFAVHRFASKPIDNSARIVKGQCGSHAGGVLAPGKGRGYFEARLV
ncbi:hypothetical protein, partial [Acidovorax kalamii]|uniref:hypothetical protein n=1 Tax=Acidovorax kalamii TaxID=2004485 RepID=UPI00197A8CDF